MYSTACSFIKIALCYSSLVPPNSQIIINDITVAGTFLVCAVCILRCGFLYFGKVGFPRF